MNRIISTLCLVMASLYVSPLLAGEIHVIVNKDLALSKLDEQDIRGIFMARRDSFPSGQKAIPLDRSATSPLYENFYNNVLHKRVAELNSYWSRKMFTGSGMPPRQIASDREIIQMVSENPAYIAYVEGDVTADNVKVVYSVKVP